MVVQAVEDIAESVWLLDQAQTEPATLGIVGWIDFTADVTQQIAKLRAGPGGTKLCGVRYMAQGYAEVPSDRLMFGPDWPVSILAITYERWMTLVREHIAALGERDQSEILGLTAQRVYSL